MTLALNQHRCRPDYTIRLVTSQAIAMMLSDRCELCVYSIRFVPFFRRWLFILERETKMFDAKRNLPRSSLESSTQKSRYIFRAFRACKERMRLVEFHSRMSTFSTTFDKIFRSFVWWKKGLMDWKVATDCSIVKAIRDIICLQCNLTTFLVWTTGVFPRV